MQSFTHFLGALLLLTLSATTLATAISSPDTATSPRIAIRQTTTTGTAPGTVLNEALACAQYSRIANLSVIGTNSTYRAAFLDSSPVGTMLNSAMMNKAMADNMALMMDAALNTACGNATAIAITEAASNFTRNVVAQFTFTGNPSSVTVGPIIAVTTGLALLCFSVFTAV